MRDKEKAKAYQKAYQKEYYQRNKEKVKERAKEYRENNKEKVAKLQRECYQRDKEGRAEYGKKYREMNKEGKAEYQKEYQKNNREKLNKRIREKRLNDPAFRIRCNLHSRLWQAVKNQGTTKDSTTMDLVGCSLHVLVSHLESQFTEGMTWDNYGEWHIDHIRPCASFDLKLDGEQKKCFNYNNLQPLWAEDNLTKSAKYDISKI